jgi:hypothetical protein
MRQVCLEILGKSDLLEEDLPLIVVVAKSPHSNLELSLLDSHSCPMCASP